MANDQPILQLKDVAYSWFRETDALFDCGPTGTNVMDIAIAIKSDD